MISFRERRPWLVGTISVVLIAIAFGLAFSVNRFDRLKGVYRLAVDLEDAAGIQPGNEIRVAGVKVGNVRTIELTDDAARIHFDVRRDVELPETTRVEVKLKTLLGQKFMDLQVPLAYQEDPLDRPGTTRLLEAGDVIPMSQTKLPFEIHEAATQGTATLEQIDKEALSDMLDVLADTVTSAEDELGRALGAIDDAGKVLRPKGNDISRLLRNLTRVTGTLAESDEHLRSVLGDGADILQLLAERRQTISTLLRATNDLAGNLGLLIQAARGSISLGVNDLDGVLLLVEGEMDTIERALQELDDAQRMFAQPLLVGRFTEGAVCVVTSADTCTPKGSPADPGIPSHGVQPIPSSLPGPT